MRLGCPIENKEAIRPISHGLWSLKNLERIPDSVFLRVVDPECRATSNTPLSVDYHQSAPMLRNSFCKLRYSSRISFIIENWVSSLCLGLLSTKVTKDSEVTKVTKSKQLNIGSKIKIKSGSVSEYRYFQPLQPARRTYFHFFNFLKTQNLVLQFVSKVWNFRLEGPFSYFSLFTIFKPTVDSLSNQRNKI